MVIFDRKQLIKGSIDNKAINEIIYVFMNYAGRMPTKEERKELDKISEEITEFISKAIKK